MEVPDKQNCMNLSGDLCLYLSSYFYPNQQDTNFESILSVIF